MTHVSEHSDRDIDAYFENLGETMVGALLRHWSGKLRADAQLWLAAKAREAKAQTEAAIYPATVVASPAAATTDQRAFGGVNKTVFIVPAIAAAALVANILMVAYLVH